MRLHSALALLALGAALPACARAQQPARPPAAADSAAGARAGDDPTTPEGELLPAGLGSLSRDEISVRLRDEQLEVSFTPLDERVLRLLAPDTYTALRGLVTARRPAVDSVGQRYGISNPGLAVVSFFGRREDARFDPELVSVTARGRILRPVGILPMGAAFSSQQLGLRGQANALYVFDELLPVDDQMQVSYGVLSTFDWERRLPAFERERARIAARSRAPR